MDNFNTELDLYIYGKQPVLEALTFPDIVKKIWIAPDATGKPINQIKRLAEQNDKVINYIPKNDIQKFVGAVVHQGVAAHVIFNPFIADEVLEKFILAKKNPLILILDQIQDPHNLGAIIRTAEIAQTDLIVLSAKGTAPVNATVAKTSAGALFGIKLYQSTILVDTIERLKTLDIKILTSLPNTANTIYQADLTNPLALLIGSEDRGIRKHLLNLSDESVSIPQMGKVNSLNASVSAAIILYETMRQRHFK